MNDLKLNTEMKAYTPLSGEITFKLIQSKRSKYVGKTLKNKQGETFKVLGLTDIKSPQGFNDRYLIEFEDGTRLVVAGYFYEDISVKNPNSPTVQGVGFQGLGKYKFTTYPKEHQTWRRMITRCYSEEYQKRNRTYVGCYVDERWHNFQNFCEDLPSLEGYTLWKNNTEPRAYALDKDSLIENNKVYSKYTCRFITCSENSLLAQKDKTNKLTGLTYIATSPSGEVVEFTNQTEFAREHSLTPQHVSACIKGKWKSSKGWTFKIKK